MPVQVPPTILCVWLTGTDAAVRAFLVRHPTEIASVRRDAGSVIIEVFVAERVVAEIPGGSLKVEVVYNATARGIERLKGVVPGNRFADRRSVPKGLGRLIR